MSDSDTIIVARPMFLTTIANLLGGLFLGIFGFVGVFVELKVAGLVFLLPALYLLLSLRRKASVTASELVAQGRLSSRRVALRDLTQVAMSVTGFPWVASSTRRPFHLRMVREGTTDRNPGAATFIERVRELAARAGAQLEAEPEKPSSPAGADPWFSA